MLSQVHPLPLHVQIPRYLGDYNINPVSRPKSSSSSSYFAGISTIVSTSLSPSRPDSAGEYPDRAHHPPSPASPQENSSNFEIVGRSTPSFDSSLCQADSYENSDSPLRSSQSQHYPSVSGAPSNSPSPVDVQQPHPSAASPSQDRFPHSSYPLYPGPDRTISDPNPNPERRCLENMDKYSTAQGPSTLLDQRRMSEPAVLTNSHIYPHNQATDAGSSSRQPSSFLYSDYSKSPPPSMYLSPVLHRGASTGSLRDIRQQHYQYPPPSSGWKHESDRPYDQVNSLDEPLSPFQSTFTGGLSSPTGVSYPPTSGDFYGPSPPGTSTSASSSGPMNNGVPLLPQLPPFRSPQRADSFPTHPPSDNLDRKNYSFIALPGNAVKKRPRRRYDEIERLYQCSWPDCAKAYGTLNHLNAHVTMQKHGPKRSPNEFKELRKQWRKAKKEAESHETRRAVYAGSREYDYDGARFTYSTSPPRSHLTGLDFGSSALQSTQSSFHHGQYADGIEDSRYPSHPREDHSVYLGGSSRSHHSNGLALPWQESSSTDHRSVVPSSLSHIPHSAHDSKLPPVFVTNTVMQPQSLLMPPSPRRLINSLPVDSTLLNPLPAYHAQPVSLSGVDHFAYTAEGYELYGEGDSRPSTSYTQSSAGPPADEDLNSTPLP